MSTRLHATRSRSRPLDSAEPALGSTIVQHTDHALPAAVVGLAHGQGTISRSPEHEATATQRFELATTGGTPPTETVGAARLDRVRLMLSGLSAAERATIAHDPALIEQAHMFVGATEYASLLAAVGMCAPHRLDNGDVVALHQRGDEVDAHIRAAAATVSHLLPYVDAAIQAGRQGALHLAVVSAQDWSRLFVVEFPEHEVGSEFELTMKGFTSTQHRDQVIILHADRGGPSTGIRACLRRYMKPAISGMWGDDFYDGVVEYFTRLITDRNGKPAVYGGPPRTNYQQSWEFVRLDLIPFLGSNRVEQETVLAEIAFNGRTSLLKKCFDRACLAQKIGPAVAAQRWDKFDSAITDGRWSDARRLRPSPDPKTLVTHPPEYAFVQTVRAGRPLASTAEGAQRMDRLRLMLSALPPDSLDRISHDVDLMIRARRYVGWREYVSLLAAVGVYRMTKRDGVETRMHMTGAEADTFVMARMVALPHLKPYADAAVKGGLGCRGYVAVVGEHEWKDAFASECAGDGADIKDEPYVAAFTSVAHRDKVIIVHKDRGSRGELIHECMHRYARDAILDVWGMDFNEGVTEYFARLIADSDGRVPRPNGSKIGLYQQSWEFVCDSVLPLLGKDRLAQEVVLAEMNFNGNATLLRLHFENACAAKWVAAHEIAARWARFEGAIMTGEWNKARAEVP
jgi:hypothetical protein